MPPPPWNAALPFSGSSPLISWVVQPTIGASIPLSLYIIGRYAFGRPIGLLAALVGAVYGPFVGAVGLILPSAAVPLLTCLALFGLLMTQQRGLGRDWLLAGVAVILLLWAQSNSFKEVARRTEAPPGQQLSLESFGRKLRLAFTAVERGPSADSQENPKRQLAIRRLPLLTFGVIGPLGLLGLLLSLRRWRQIGVLHIAFVASLGFLLAGVVSGTTRLILIPPLLVCAAFAVCWAYDRAVENARRPLAAAGVALALLTFLIHLPIPISQSQALAKIEEVKAQDSEKQQMPAKQEPVKGLSGAGNGGYRTHLRRAGLYSSQGKLEEAAQEFERAAALAPPETALDIRIRLALSLEEGERYLEAKRRWEAVAALEPPPGIAQLARRHLIRIKRKLQTEQPPAAEQKGVKEWEHDTE